MDEPVIDLHSDHYFMGEALRQAARAYEVGEAPVGAVVVRESRVIAHAFNQVEALKFFLHSRWPLALPRRRSALLPRGNGF